MESVIDIRGIRIGHHRKLGLLIYDAEAQRVGADKVRLFRVNQKKTSTFIKDTIRTKEHWSSDEEHNPRWHRAVAEYTEARARLRETHCYRCKDGLNSVDFSICKKCNWIRCSCGACGCEYTDPR